MTDRVRWRCPGCSQLFSVPSDVGLSVCPGCKERDDVTQQVAVSAATMAALDRQQNGEKVAKKLLVAFSAIAAVAVAIAMLSWFDQWSKESAMRLAAKNAHERYVPTATIPTETFGKAERVTLQNASLLPTTEDWNEASKHASRGDDVGIQQMVRRGQLLLPPPGTQAQILSTGMDGYEVRIIGGPMDGKSGWVLKDNVKKR